MGKAMTIGFDASRATIEKKTGTEYYTAQLLFALSKIDRKNQYVLYSDQAPRGKLAKLPQNYSWKILPFPPRLWQHTRLTWEIFRYPVDLFFEPAHTTPIFAPRRTKIVAVIHDLSFLHFPNLYNKMAFLYHKFSIKRAISLSNKIITISQYTKNDIVKKFNISPDKVEVIPLGYDQHLYKFTPKKKPYIFYVGRLEKKKNIIGMLEAYRLLRQEKNINHKFILAGSKGFGWDEIKKKIDSIPANISKDIILLGYVRDEEISRLMKEADIFLFASFFEGFGIPIIEAMACGTPVITSNITAMPETAGSAALKVNPKKPFEIAAALSKIIHSDKIRKSLISKGRARSALYSWEKTAEKTLRIIEEEANE